ncbi:hypothetical protein [Cerasicoccus maritimus]|uniref:hypothetical protein n=1 Tax=Cerasicoccus maritimus TaxID=490089 RepID=UPI0028526039|nr:hypothetical protein [Cerasicoccus maritimus]
MTISASALSGSGNIDWLENFGFEELFNDEQFEALDAAIDSFDEDEDVAPLKALWQSGDDVIPNLAFAYYLCSLEYEDAAQYMSSLNKHEQTLELGKLAGMLSHDTAGASYILSNTDQFDDQLTNAMLSLLTGETYSTPEAWKHWLEAHPNGFDWDAMEDPVVLRARVQKLEQQPMRNFLSSLPKDDPTGLADTFNNTFTQLFEGIEDNRQAALEANESAQLDAANRSFFLGQYAEAEQAYLHILDQDSNDAFAAFLRGCALFEMGDYAEAKLMFNLAAMLEPSSPAATYLHALAQRRLDAPEESMQHAAWAQLLATPTPDSFGLTGNGDPFIARLQGERMLFKPGIYHLPVDELLAKAAATDNPDLALGYVMLTPAEVKAVHIQKLAERFPEAIAIQQAALAYKLNSDKDPAVVLPLIQNASSLIPRTPTSSCWKSHGWAKATRSYRKAFGSPPSTPTNTRMRHH